MKNKNNEITVGKEIKESLKKIKKINDIVSNDIYGSKSTEDDLLNINKSINKIANDYKDKSGQSLLGALYSTLQNDNIDNEQKIKNIMNIVNTKDKAGVITTYLTSHQNKINRFEDLMVITQLMPQLKDAKDAIVNKIMAADEVDKQLMCNVSNIESNEIRKSETERLESKDIEFTKLIKEVLNGALTLGEYYVAVIPYSKIFNKLILRAEEKNKGINSVIKEETDVFKDTDSNTINVLGEEAIPDTFSEILYKNETPKPILEYVNSINIYNGQLSTIDEDILFESKEFKEKVKEFSKSTTKVTKSNTTNVPEDGLINIDQNKIPNVQGCKVKRLDPRRLVKLDAGNTRLGYYYFEKNEKKNMFKDPTKLNLSSMLKSREKDNDINSIIQPVGDLLIKRLNKKFIESNLEIKSQIYDIVKASLKEEEMFNIIYLDADEVQEVSCLNGESPFLPSLFFAKIYLLVLLTSTTAKVLRGNDIRAYYMDADAQQQVSSDIATQMFNLKRMTSTPLFANNVSKVMGFNPFTDLYLIRNNDAKAPLETDIIPGQSIDIPLDFLEMLAKMCVDPIMPLQLLQSSTEAEYARSFTVLNAKFLNTVVNYQLQFGPQISELRKKILKTFTTDENEINAINREEFSFQIPTILVLNSLSEIMGNVKDYAQNIADIIMGQNNTNENADRIKDKLILSICKEKVPGIPWDKYEQTVKNISIKLKEEDILNSDESEAAADDVDVDNL